MKIETEKGIVSFKGAVNPKELESLDINSKLNNFRPALKQKQALIKISQMPDGMIFIAQYQQEIIGYVTFHHMDSFTRWGKHPNILEMGGVEISPDWRRYKIGGQLLKFSFAAPELENFIALTMEYAWHWDLKNSKLSTWNYQKMLTNIFSQAGLRRFDTNDPEILSHPCNVLMAKIGKDVSQKDIELFKDLLFMKE